MKKEMLGLALASLVAGFTSTAVAAPVIGTSTSVLATESAVTTVGHRQSRKRHHHHGIKIFKPRHDHRRGRRHNH